MTGDGRNLHGKLKMENGKMKMESGNRWLKLRRVLCRAMLLGGSPWITRDAGFVYARTTDI